MSNQLNFFLGQALSYLQNGNLSSAQLLLRQVLKIKADHADAHRLMGVIYAQKGELTKALESVQKSISANKRNGISYSNKGNIELMMGRVEDAMASFQKAIVLAPNYAEAHSNFGNAYQDAGQIDKAIDSYMNAISLDSNNPEFFCNLGNAYWKLDQLGNARKSFERSIELAPGHANALHNLAHLDLLEFNFSKGWARYEARWLISDHDKPIAIDSTKPRWDGLPKEGRLFIWAEQGIGDQILYSSMFNDLERYPQTKIVSVDKRLIPIFQRSFPSMQFVNKDIGIPDEEYDEHIPMGSLGLFLRSSMDSFRGAKSPYLVPKASQVNNLDLNKLMGGNPQCGLSWRSSRAKLGSNKSIPINLLAPLLSLKGINFVNLQYGDVGNEVSIAKNAFGVNIQIFEDINLFDDIDSLLSILEACNVVVTTSNSTAHLAGALGKETLLFLPRGNSRFWYWHDIDNFSIWYPSIRVFKQEQQGDWAKPIEAAKIYLENRFAI